MGTRWHRSGPSDLVAILGVVADFLHKPYNSVEDPLDVWFHNLVAGSVVPAFSIGYSVGMAKSMAALAILYSTQKLEAEGSLTADEFAAMGPQIAALLSIKAMTDPGASIEDQVSKSISKKLRVTDRPRPQAIQLHTAFSKVVHHRRATGDTRPESQLLALAIKNFNAQQIAKNRVTADEREAILNLHGQTPGFRKLLAEHWQTFPVPCSAVPVSLLSKAWHGNTYEPQSVKKSVSPRTFEALLGSPDKREMWLRRVIGKYMKNLKDARASGKSVNIRSFGPILRKEPDDEMVRHMACMFVTWVPAFRSSLSQAGFDELLQRFYRGALDRELAEKVKSADESLAVGDWRFVTAMAEFLGNDEMRDGSMQDAESDKLAADLKLDVMVLRREAKMWSVYQSQMRMFHAETHNAKVEEQQAMATTWDEHAKGHISIRYPVRGLKKQQDAPATITTVIENFAEHLSLKKVELYKVYMANLTYIGHSYEKRIAELISIVRDKLNNDKDRSCALFVAPNTGCFRQTYDEVAAEKARREVLDLLRDDANEFFVSDVTAFFDPSTMWSKTRRTKHDIFMCVHGKRNTDGNLVSTFSRSRMFIRQSLSQWVTCHPRHEFVDPTARINTDRGNLSQMRERMQWITGDSFYSVLARDLWADMPVSCEDGACWIDIVGYDQNLTNTMMARTGSPDASQPREMCCTIVSGFGQDQRQVEEFLENRIYSKLRSKCEQKTYVLTGAPDLSVMTQSSKVFVQPTYSEDDYKLTKPLADNTLPIRATVVARWLSSGVPTSLQDKFKAELVTHNATYNTSGRQWAPEATKRPAESPALGQDAVEMPKSEDDPNMVEDITKKHKQMCEKIINSVKFMSSLNGDLYAIVSEDVVFSKSTAIALLSGDYLVGGHYDNAINNGADLFEWAMNSDEYSGFYTTEPDLRFSSNEAPLHEYLHFLESKSKVSLKIECHNWKRTSAASGPDRNSSYTVTSVEKCGFKPRPGGLVNQKVPHASGISIQAVKGSKLLRLVMRMKYVDDLKIVQPQRPGLYFQKDMRMRKGLYKLL